MLGTSRVPARDSGSARAIAVAVDASSGGRDRRARSDACAWSTAGNAVIAAKPTQTMDPGLDRLPT